MASFTGTNKQFKRYIGPILRNIVQQISRKHKKEIGICQHCSETESLEAAHVNEKGRNDIIDQILENYTYNGMVTVNIEKFEEEFKKAHHPIDKSILVLCKTCHTSYDSKQTNQKKDIVYGYSDTKKSISNNQEKLPIYLHPKDADEFKQELLTHKKAEIETNFSDGAVEKSMWNASKFSPSSDVIGNLRSRPNFRKGNWQALGIKHINVRIVK